jgi:hypothetical protein
MKIYTSLALASLAAAQADSTYHDPLNLFTLRRSYLTCQETYGGGSEICGDPATSHYCYDPTLGDVSFPLPLVVSTLTYELDMLPVR